MSASVHGRGLEYEGSGRCFKYSEQSDNCHSTLDGLRINSYENRTSDIGSDQCQAYCWKFKLLSVVEPSENRMMKCIRGRASSIGNVFIHVPFKNLDVVIDVLFIVIEEDSPNSLSMKDILDNVLDISIQCQYVSLGKRRQPLTMEAFFLVHR